MAEDFDALRDLGQRALARGDHDTAAQALARAAQDTSIPELDYVAVMDPLRRALAARGDHRSALSVHWYLAPREPGGWAAARSMLPHVPPIDRARTLFAGGDRLSAAQEMESAGCVAAAAIYREKASDFAGARALWSRLAQVISGGADAYNAALVQFNLARCAKGCNDARQAREAIVSAVRLVEEAADQFETVGQRERAFDCFQVLLAIGRAAGTFEDVLEGYVNCVRILREDHMKVQAIQHFDEAIDAARKRGELSAAATLAREAAEYTRALTPSAQTGYVDSRKISAYYTLLQAELWRDVAKQHLERGAPAEIAENALLAAVLAYGESGQYDVVGGIYGSLAQLEIEAARRAHYQRAAQRYVGVADERLDAAPLPPHLRRETHFPDVWHVDLLEWEQQGSAAEACADVLLEHERWPDMLRRLALVARLTAFAVEGRGADAATTGARVRLAEQLAALRIYAVFSPLEKLFERPEPEVRVAVLAAIENLRFKRSFLTLRLALRDAEPRVVERAAAAIEQLSFEHAFDPLARIVREAPQPRARGSALRAVAKIDTTEAAEFLLGVLEHGAAEEQAATADALKRGSGVRFPELAIAMVTSGASPALPVLREILRARGFRA